jgi:hypothetical protein
VKEKLKGEGEETVGLIRNGISCGIWLKARGAVLSFLWEFIREKEAEKKWRAALLCSISPYPRLSLAHHIS